MHGGIFHLSIRMRSIGDFQMGISLRERELFGDNVSEYSSYSKETFSCISGKRE